MIGKKDIAYIAGPMSKKPALNYPAFYGMAALLKREYECRILNPARQPHGLDYEEYMRRAFTDLDRATVIVLLAGWQNSPGARREYIHAADRGIRAVCEAEIIEDVDGRIRHGR